MSRWRRLPSALAISLSLLSLAPSGSAAESRTDAKPPAASAIGGSRASAYAAYQNVLKPALAVPIGWNGSRENCVAGAPSRAAQDATLTAVNFFREMAGLSPVTFDASLSAKAQQAALMMYAQGALSHNPGPDWACYTADGREGAANSNLALGVPGAKAVAAYMDDHGDDNYPVGHRRWILYPHQSSMGSGSTCCSNALWVPGAHVASSAPPWVAWPTPGYFPFQLEPEGRWSLSASSWSTDFSKAQVSVASGGVQLPVNVRPVVNGYGSPTLVWELNPGYATGRADRAYDVSVTNILQNGAPVSHQYTVRLFDAEIDADQTISFPPLANRVYGDAAFTATATASSGLPVSFTSITPAVCATGGPNGATVILVGAGTCTVRADQPGDGTRNPAPSAQRSFTVAKKQLTVRARNVARLVGTPNPPLAAAYSGFAYGQTLETSGVSGAPSCSTTATPESPAGTYPITCAPGTLTSANYAFTMVPGTLTVRASPAKADMAIWHPPNGAWYVRLSSANWDGHLARQWGVRGDVPLASTDFDGDGRADMVVWRPSNGTWYVRTSTTGFDGFLVRQWGLPGDVPLASTDFDGDDGADMVVWRPSDGTWYARLSSANWEGFVVRQWGASDSIPLADSDFDGDGRADMAIWHPPNGAWYVRLSSANWDGHLARQWGVRGDVPLASTDFDGDGRADMAVWRPSNGTWYVRTSTTGFDGFLVRQWGVRGDVPLGRTDFDGDGRADMAVWRPSNGTWYVRLSSANWDAFLARQWGASDSVPLADSDFDA